MAISLPARILVLCYGIALFLFLGPSIIAMIINPMVWFDALIAIYFLIAGICAYIFFFSKKLLYLIILLPALSYILLGLLWLWLY